MSGGGDFRAAIEEEKRKAKDAYMRRKSEAWRGKAELVSPLTAEMHSVEPFSGIPGLGTARPTTGFDDQPLAKAFEDRVEAEPISPIDSADPIKSQKPSTTTSYAGLVSARKRKHDEPSSTAETSASRRKSAASESSRSGGIENRTRRPFAPAKKASRGARPIFDEM